MPAEYGHKFLVISVVLYPMSIDTNLLSPQWGYAQLVWTLICCHLIGIIPSRYGYKFVVTSVGLYPPSMDTNLLSSQWGYIH